ncbi:hypothetical protein ANRL4_01812 [Anaerolineae bacterium]|nr:hypothetical protein ANRL4_01812 [Anaerolineae bacterium]
MSPVRQRGGRVMKTSLFHLAVFGIIKEQSRTELCLPAKFKNHRQGGEGQTDSSYQKQPTREPTAHETEDGNEACKERDLCVDATVHAHTRCNE